MAIKQKQPSTKSNFVKFQIIRDEPIPPRMYDLNSNLEIVHKLCMLSSDMEVGDSMLFDNIFEANILIHCFNATGESSFIMKKKKYFQVWRV